MGSRKHQSWVQYYSVLSFNNLDNGMENVLIKFADDTKLGGVASTLEDRIQILNNFDILENGSEINKT